MYQKYLYIFFHIFTTSLQELVLSVILNILLICYMQTKLIEKTLQITYKTNKHALRSSIQPHSHVRA